MLLSYCFQFIVKTIVSVQCITLFCVECTLCHLSFRHLKKKKETCLFHQWGTYCNMYIKVSTSSKCLEEESDSSTTGTGTNLTGVK